MTLTRGKRLGGAFLDLKELAADGPVVCVFRVREFQAPEKATGFDGVNLPVIADVLICDGPRKGEVHLGERFIGAITAPLRGVRNPKRSEQPQPPETAVGDEIVLRVKVVNAGKANAGAVGDEPSDSEMAAAEAVHANGAGWNAAPMNGNGATQQSAAAGAGGGQRPW
jgi:hypothetical protein